MSRWVEEWFARMEKTWWDQIWRKKPQEFIFDGKFNVHVRHPQWDVKKGVKRESWAQKKCPTKDKKFRIIILELLLKIMGKIRSSRKRVYTCREFRIHPWGTTIGQRCQIGSKKIHRAWWCHKNQRRRMFQGGRI